MSFKEFSSHLNERLIQSCKKNDSEDVLFCLQQGADVNINCKDEDGTTFTGLSIAASRNNPELVDLLLARGADVNKTTVKVKQKRKSKSNKTTLYKYGEVTPLMIASHHGHTKIVNRLIKVHGIDILFEDSRGWTALHLCAGSKECLEEFAKISIVDWNCVDCLSQTPLFHCVGNSNCVKFILSQPGVNPNIQDEDSDTPILWCLKQMDRDMMEEFKRHMDNLDFPMPMVEDFDFEEMEEMEEMFKTFKNFLDCPRIELDCAIAWAREQAAEPESSSWARRWRTEIVMQMSRALESRAVDVKKRKHGVGSDNTPEEKKRKTDS